MSTLKEIKDAVVAGIVEWTDANTFMTRQPDQPDKCLTFYEYDGSPSYQMTNDAGYEMVYVQARVRDVTYSGARASLITLRDFLNAQSGTIGGTKYALIRSTTTPTRLELDAQDRESLVLNFEVMKEQS